MRSKQKDGPTNWRMIKTSNGRTMVIPEGVSERSMQLIIEKSGRLKAAKTRMGKKVI